MIELAEKHILSCTYVSSQVTVLMSVDLLRQQQRWKDALADIRQMMATLVQEVCYTYI